VWVLCLDGYSIRPLRREKLMVVDERRGAGATGVVRRGPLTSCEALVRAELDREGHAAASVRDVPRAMARLSAWMDVRVSDGGPVNPWAGGSVRG
jgi:hypothetical protein